jgi:hypothetical protein
LTDGELWSDVALRGAAPDRRKSWALGGDLQPYGAIIPEKIPKEESHYRFRLPDFPLDREWPSHHSNQSQNASGYQNLTFYGDNVGGLEWKRPLHKGWRTRLFSIDCDFSPPAMLDSLSFVCEQNYCFGQRSFVDFLSKYMLIVRNGISQSEVPNISFIPLRLSHAPNDHK